MRTRRESIDLIRMFNRRYVPVMRLLDRSYLGTGSSTLEIAVLIEIGEREAVSARDISRLLSVDKGYLSRTIRRFEEQGLVARTASGADARVQLLSLTDSGRDRVAELSDSGADVVADMGVGVRNDRTVEVDGDNCIPDSHCGITFYRSDPRNLSAVA